MTAPIEAFLTMPIPWHSYAVWAKDGDSSAAEKLQEYEDAKAAALAQWRAIASIVRVPS